MGEIVIPKGFGPPPARFRNVDTKNNEFAEGIASSYAVIGYKGRDWSLKYRGAVHQLPTRDMEVVLVRSSRAKSKLYYAKYVEGSTNPPDCWSSDGQTPDPSVQNPQHKNCAQCPMNQFGSKVMDDGRKTRACADHKRLAVVPSGDLTNDAFGGPMLLRVPAGSLSDLANYTDTMLRHGYDPTAVITRVSFEPGKSYPKMLFNAVRPLTDEEAETVYELRDDPRTLRIIGDAPHAGEAGEVEAPAAKPLFEQPPQQAAPPPAARKPVARSAIADAMVKPAVREVEQAEEPPFDDAIPASAGTASLDDKLASLLPRR